MDLRRKKNCLRLMERSQSQKGDVKKRVEFFISELDIPKDNILCMQESRKFNFVDITLKASISAVDIYFQWKKKFPKSDFLLFCSDVGREREIVISIDDPFITEEIARKIFKPYVLEIVYKRDYQNWIGVWDGRRVFKIWIENEEEFKVPKNFKLDGVYGNWYFVERKPKSKDQSTEKKEDEVIQPVMGKEKQECNEVQHNVEEVKEEIKEEKKRKKKKDKVKQSEAQPQGVAVETAVEAAEKPEVVVKEKETQEAVVPEVKKNAKARRKEERARKEEEREKERLEEARDPIGYIFKMKNLTEAEYALADYFGGYDWDEFQRIREDLRRHFNWTY